MDESAVDGNGAVPASKTVNDDASALSKFTPGKYT